MYQIHWLKRLGTSFVGRSSVARRFRHGWHERRRPSTHPYLEALEERCVLSGGDVTSTAGLIAAINAANTSGNPTTIALAPGTTFAFAVANNRHFNNDGNALPVITGNITIVGNGDTIERVAPPSSTFRLFEVEFGASLNLQNLTLKGGLVEGGTARGGAVESSGSLNLGGVTVQSNAAVGIHGANSATNSHNSPSPGGNAFGGGIYVFEGTLTLTSDLITANKAVGGNGGNCHEDHTAGAGGEAQGGGVCVAPSAARSTLIGDTFDSNSAIGGNGGNANTTGGHPSELGAGGTGGVGGNAQGGGLYVSVGSSMQQTISLDYFDNNKAQGGTGGNGGDPTPSFKGNLDRVGNGGAGGNAQGGGLYATGPGFFPISYDSDFISNNAAVGGAGGWGGATRDGLVCPGGNGGSATGGGVLNGQFSGLPTLIDTVIGPDTVTGGTAGVDDPGRGGKGISPLIYGSAMTLTVGSQLPPGTVATPYVTQTITALPVNSNDTTATISYKLTSSSLGLNFSAVGNTLTISGTPTAAGAVNFTVTATDSDGSTVPQDYTMAINPSPSQSPSPSPLPSPPPSPSPSPPTSPSPAPSSSPPLPTSPPAPPSLNVPSLLATFDSLLGGVETVNANGTETIVDSLFGFPLFVSTFDSHGNLVSVDLFGIDITFLFE